MKSREVYENHKTSLVDCGFVFHNKPVRTLVKKEHLNTKLIDILNEIFEDLKVIKTKYFSVVEQPNGEIDITLNINDQLYTSVYSIQIKNDDFIYEKSNYAKSNIWSGYSIQHNPKLIEEFKSTFGKEVFVKPDNEFKTYDLFSLEENH